MLQVEFEGEKTLRVKLVEKKSFHDESFARTFQNTKMIVTENIVGEEMTVVRQGPVQGSAFTFGRTDEWNFVIRKSDGETRSFVAPFFDTVMAYHYYVNRVVPVNRRATLFGGRSTPHTGLFGSNTTPFSAFGGRTRGMPYDKATLFGAMPPADAVPDGAPNGVPDEVDTPKEAMDVEKKDFRTSKTESLF